MQNYNDIYRTISIYGLQQPGIRGRISKMENCLQRDLLKRLFRCVALFNRKGDITFFKLINARPVIQFLNLSIIFETLAP